MTTLPEVELKKCDVCGRVNLPEWGECLFCKAPEERGEGPLLPEFCPSSKACPQCGHLIFFTCDVLRGGVFRENRVPALSGTTPVARCPVCGYRHYLRGGGEYARRAVTARTDC